jgi:hypothetical protein
MQRADILKNELRQNDLTGVHMNVRYALAALILGVWLITVAGPLHAVGYLSRSVYKSVDSSGKVTYSSVRPDGAVVIEKIRIEAGPPTEYIAETRERHEKITEIANELAEARETRKTEREEEEIRRLERLALQQAVKPRVIERKVYVGWRPLWWPLPPIEHYHYYPGQQPSSPAHHPGLRSGAVLSTTLHLR